MLKLLLRACISGLRCRQQLALENLALRHQIEVLHRTAGRHRLRTADRALWVLLSRICRSLQLIQAFPFDSAPRFLIRDRDSIYGEQVVETIRVLGVEQKIIAYESPWQNGNCERVIGSIRRDCRDHVIVFGERHLRRVLREYLAYYHGSRTHLGLGKDAPEPRAIRGRDEGAVVSAPVLGGLHHRYWRQAA